MRADGNGFLLQVEDLRKQFDGRAVLESISISVPRASIFSVVGPSGAGKSVLLKCIADVLQPDRGRIFFDGSPLPEAGGRVREDFRRRCSFLFQSNALFDSLTAIENVALPLEQTTRLGRREIRSRAIEALRQLDIEHAACRYPSELSGGMQKRLALARAIVTRPELVFFDEPTAGLDPLRRNAVFAMISQYQRQFGFTALVVTHDIAEALIASDRVALLDRGRIRFEGTPQDFSASDHPVVKSFRNSTSALGESIEAIRRGEAVVSAES